MSRRPNRHRPETELRFLPSAAKHPCKEVEPLRIGVISDTHIPGRGKRLPDEVFRLFEGGDAIFHAGDFVATSVLETLEGVAPVHGVLGNCDLPDLVSRVPPMLSIDIGGVKVGMIHDSGPAAGRRQRMQAMFSGHRVVIFGHSHRPLIEDDGELLLINPGSACDPRWAKTPSVATLVLAEGIPEATLVEL